MGSSNEKLFKAREFAELTGVTVRTLHHYDQLGLLKPSRYSRAGYRLYTESDVVRLEQIVALKFIGFSLQEIKDILKCGSVDLATALRRQREAITEKRQQLDIAIQAIERAEYVIATTQDRGWETLIKIIEVITMQNDMDWSKKYYSEEAQREIEKRAATIPREVIEQAQHDWAILIKEVNALVADGEDPASDKAQALAARWSELIRAFTGGNREIQSGLNKMYADSSNWPTSMPKPFGDEVQAFIVAATKHREKK
jgi:MerR family transcriptional regulator, thiopeptide resistance regulator